MESGCGVLNIPKDMNYLSLNHCMSCDNSNEEGFYRHCHYYHEIGNVFVIRSKNNNHRTCWNCGVDGRYSYKSSFLIFGSSCFSYESS